MRHETKGNVRFAQIFARAVLAIPFRFGANLLSAPAGELRRCSGKAWRRHAPCNRLVGPKRVTPLYHVVVAINVDTLYASTFLGLKDEPVILTIPKTQDIYSVLHLDQYGALVPNGLSGTNTAGVYAIVGPDW